MSKEKKRCVVLGGGGHASVLIETLQMVNDIEICAVVDRDEKKWGRKLLGVPILGNDNYLSKLIEDGVNSFVVGIGTVGDALPRMELYKLGIGFGLKPIQVVHTQSYISPSAEIGQGCQVMVKAIINSGSVIGENVIVNSGSIIEHDCEVGNHAHIAPGACLASGIVVGEGAHVGIGVVVKELINIGAKAMIGAGAVVVDDVEPNTVVAGVPAKLI